MTGCLLQTSYGSKLFDGLEEFADYLTLSFNLIFMGRVLLLVSIASCVLYSTESGVRVLSALYII